MSNFAITGVAGFVALRHLQSIAATGNVLVAAADPHDSVGLLDRFSFDVKGGRCEKCAGEGTITTKLSFMNEKIGPCREEAEADRVLISSRPRVGCPRQAQSGLRVRAGITSRFGRAIVVAGKARGGRIPGVFNQRATLPAATSAGE